MAFRHASGRSPAVALEAMIATSQQRATYSGLRTLDRGGNAVDAVLAAAAVLCVTEPMSTGLGGDAFAMIWHDGKLIGLDAAGPAPAGADPEAPVADRGPDSVTVPGAVSGWASLSSRFGRLGLDACLEDAIDIAERGYAVSPVTAERGTVQRRAARAGRQALSRRSSAPPRRRERGFACLSSAARCDGSPPKGRRRSTAARWPRRSAPRHGSRRVTSQATRRRGASRCTSATGTSR